MPCTEQYIVGGAIAERPCVGSDSPPSGCRAGAALKSILASVGIVATPDCSCNRRATEMDARGCDWCEENLELIVGWLREEAEKRKLPFLDAAGRVLVRRAIAHARKEEARAKAAKEGKAPGNGPAV